MRGTLIKIDIRRQLLQLADENGMVKEFPISTASAGTGMEAGSYKTPLGRFVIAEKIGKDCPAGMVFRSRIPAGMWTKNDPPTDEDLVTSRILWLNGLDEANKNTKERYIYIHGTNHEDRIGVPDSCGCIRMLNEDIIQLFDEVEEGTPVFIA